MPSLANSPSPTSTWQRPQMPRPPQTESRSTPSLRAASSSDVPSGSGRACRTARRRRAGWSWRGQGSRLPRGSDRQGSSDEASPLSSRPAALRGGRLPLATSASACGSRNFLIQAMQLGSWPITTSAPRMAWMSSRCSGFMIAEVMPAPIIIGRKEALSPRRFGRPKEKFEAPQVVLTLSSVLQAAQQMHQLAARHR